MGQQLSGTIVFASGKTGDYDIWTCDLESGTMTQLTFGTGWNDKPNFSPDGQWVVYVSDQTGNRELFKVPTTGGDPIQLTNLGNRWADSPSFSPDGKAIAYVSNETGNNELWVMDAEGNERKQVTVHEGSDDTVSWTPDGHGLLWSSDRGDDADIWHYDLLSDTKTQLNEDRGGDYSPKPSPDGSVIVFVSNRQETPDPSQPYKDRDKDLWMMTSQGELLVKLTENQGADYSPAWSPCGNYLLYTADDHRSDCHLRVLDVSQLVEAYQSGDQATVEQAASRLRTEAVQLDRDPLKAEVNATRHATFLTSLLPDSWMKSCYPAGYFGLERNPDWTGVQVGAGTLATDSSTSDYAG
ncbi:TolB family protein [Aeoliella mucimassa]|nr:PD40 domain-containing protein [Aeoliella mucimassa]